MTLTSTSERRGNGRRVRAGCLWLVSGLLILRGSVRAETGPLQEYAIKAALLFNIAKYTDWPATAFAKPDSPIVIGVLGDDPFGETLDRVVQGRSVNGRPIIVRRSGGVAEMKGAHVVFISPTETQVVQQCVVLESFRIVAVGDTAQTEACAAVNFGVERDKVVFSVDLDRVARAQATISSRLLNYAKKVKRATGTDAP